MGRVYRTHEVCRQVGNSENKTLSIKPVIFDRFFYIKNMWFKIGCATYWVVELRRTEGLFGPFYTATCTNGPGCTVEFEQRFERGYHVTFCNEDGLPAGKEIELERDELAEAVYRRLETELALKQLEDL